YYSGCQQVIHTFNVVDCSGTCSSSISNNALNYLNCGAYINLVATYSSPIDSAIWDLGNGTVLFDDGNGIPTQFFDGGSYLVELTAYHSSGCISNTGYSIILLTEIQTVMNVPDTVACAGQLFAGVAATGGGGQYAYYWPLTGATINNTVIPVFQDQWVVVQVTDTYTNCTVSDSVYVYANEAINTNYELCMSSIDLVVDPGSMVYQWSYTDVFGNSSQLPSTNNQWTADQLGTYVCFTYYSGCQTVTHVFEVIECGTVLGEVWPGDANSDNIVTNADALYLGLAFNQTGPVRPSATLNWVGQPCPDWTFNFAVNNVNLKHADCDGNGIVNFDDTLAIDFNYLNTHNKFEGLSMGGNPPIWIEATPDTVGLEQAIDIIVHLGTASQPVDSLHGVSFSLTFNESLLEENGFTVDFDNCVLGTAGNDVLTFQKSFFNDGVIDLAVTRNTLQNFQGYGPIAHARIVTTDNLSGMHDLPITISNAFGLTASETEVALTAVPDTIVIDPNKVGIDEEAFADLIVYPNPNNGRFTITGVASGSLTVLNALGQTVRTEQLVSTESNVDFSEMKAGVYTLRLETEKGTAVRRIQILR
ncbi:MAG: hypothetical protein RL266_966, partial [Bacteroidota bacterium]